MAYWWVALSLLLMVTLPFVLPSLLSACFSQEPHVWTRRQRFSVLGVGLLLLVLATGLYRQLGSAPDVLLQRELQSMPAESMYSGNASWQSLMQRMSLRLAERPDNAGYLRVLAEDASSREDWSTATGYYQRLAEVSGHDPDVETLVLTARFMAAGRTIDAALRADMEALLSLDPSQASVRGMLGMAAYERGDLHEAIEEWQQALKHLPADDPVAVMLRQGVVRARTALGESLPVVVLRVPRPVDVTASADATVFVFLSRQDARMPLAARKLRFEQLPAELALGAEDVLGGQSWPVTGGRVQATARLIPAGAVGADVLWEAHSGWVEASALAEPLDLTPVSPLAAPKAP